MEILRISKDETFFRKRQARNADEVDDVQPSSKAGSGGREKSENRKAKYEIRTYYNKRTTAWNSSLENIATTLDDTRRRERNRSIDVSSHSLEFVYQILYFVSVRSVHGTGSVASVHEYPNYISSPSECSRWEKLSYLDVILPRFLKE